MCSRVPVGSGRSRPISKPRIPMHGTSSGSALLSQATRSLWELSLSQAMRRASMAIRADNSAPHSRSSLCVHAYRWGLDAAGLSQSLKYRCWGPVRDQRGSRRRHLSRRGVRTRPAMPLASMAMRRTIVRQAAEQSMCSRVPVGSGLSRPISKPQTPGACSGTVVALAGDTLAVGAPFEASNATGVNGNRRGQ